MQDLKNDHIKDEVKRFFKSKSFLVFAAFLAALSLQYFRKRNENIKVSQQVSKVLFESDYVKIKDVASKDGALYTIPKFVLLSQFMSKDIKVFEKDINKLLTDIKEDEHFGVLSQIWLGFNSGKEINLSSLNSPWASLIRELKVINLKAPPMTMQMIPLLAAKKVTVINPGVR